MGLPKVGNYEMRKRREYVGGYSGFSVRIARGVYYRVGGFKGNPVEKTELTHVDEGVLVFTNKNLYFVGQTRSYKIPYKRSSQSFRTKKESWCIKMQRRKSLSF